MDLPPFATVPISDNADPLVDVANFDFVLDPQYFNQGLSGEKRMVLRKGVADKLLAVQTRLKNYKFKIWDAHRSREVQKKLFDAFADKLRAEHLDWTKDELVAYATQYVNMGADERIVPPHSTGGTIDLTLVDMSGAELNMGTGFDHFGIEASSLYYEENDIDDMVKGNRRLLRESMRDEGFYVYPHEWWHFEYGTQSWALATGASTAVYGETKS